MTINEKLARFAGWTSRVHTSTVFYDASSDGSATERDRYERSYCFDPLNKHPQEFPPHYDASLDLLRRDVLPRLSDEHWERLDTLLEHKWESVLASVPHPEYSWGRYILTIPAADLAAAVAEVIES